MSIKAYKGFNKDMTCRGFKYEEGKSYKEEVAKCCNSGFHACENPIDVFYYYDPAHSIYREVELNGDTDKDPDSDDSKICATEIKIGSTIDLPGMIKASIDFVMNRVKREKYADEDNSIVSLKSDNSCVKNSGYNSVASTSGYNSVASTTDGNSIAVAWGQDSKAKGVKGSYLVLSEWEYIGNGKYNQLGAKMVKVDGKEVKEDTYYTLKDGYVVEA